MHWCCAARTASWTVVYICFNVRMHCYVMMALLSLLFSTDAGLVSSIVPEPCLQLRTLADIFQSRVLAPPAAMFPQDTLRSNDTVGPAGLRSVVVIDDDDAHRDVLRVLPPPPAPPHPHEPFETWHACSTAGCKDASCRYSK